LVKYPELKFVKNWNNKLYCHKFTTIRMHTKERAERYEAQIGTIFKITAPDFKGVAKLVKIQTKLLWELTDAEMWYDAGYEREDFLKLMSNFYKNKDEYRGDFTPMLILFFERN